MRTINISDITLSRALDENEKALTFRKKIDIAELLDKMEIQVIELGQIPLTTEGKLFIKAVASTVKNSILSVSVGYEDCNVEFIWDALKTAKHPRLQVCASVSTSRMEFVYHKKSRDMLSIIANTVAKCRALCDDVEFCAVDATRADRDFLNSVITEAIKSGAGMITLCESTGNMLPSEFYSFALGISEHIREFPNVTLGAECNNNLGLADATVFAAIRAGATEIKASAGFYNCPSLEKIVKIFNEKSDFLSAETTVNFENFIRLEKSIQNLCNSTADIKTPFEDGVRERNSTAVFTENDTYESINQEIDRLGYTLCENDRNNIFNSFKNIISKKKQIDMHELEAIIASESMQVPQSYKLNSFVVTTGNTVDTFAHIKLEKDGKLLDGVSVGNGSVDASFLAIEKVVGCHYELDDFQIKAITEGKEAMGQTLVKLRSGGNVYSGRGISTDIVRSAVNAYLNALNKIVYEEEKS